MKVVAIFGTSAVCIGLCLFGIGCSHPEDVSFIYDFERHRAQYEELVSMLEADGITDLQPARRPPAGISKERWHRFMQLMGRLGLEGGVVTKCDVILFPLSRAGALYAGSAKGIAYAKGEVSPVLDSLDGSMRVSLAFRRLDGPWYIFHGSVWGDSAGCDGGKSRRDKPRRDQADPEQSADVPESRASSAFRSGPCMLDWKLARFPLLSIQHDHEIETKEPPRARVSSLGRASGGVHDAGGWARAARTTSRERQRTRVHVSHPGVGS